MKVFLAAITICVVLFSALFALGVFSDDGTSWVTDKEFSEFYFTGEMKNGLFNGFGNVIFHSGEAYRGFFVQGRFDGQGMFWDVSGRLMYYGGFREGLLDGHGRYYSAEGWVYEGGFSGGTFHGEGTITTATEAIHGAWEMGVQVSDHG